MDIFLNIEKIIASNYTIAICLSPEAESQLNRVATIAVNQPKQEMTISIFPL